jgi:hypothetical protein
MPPPNGVAGNDVEGLGQEAAVAPPGATALVSVDGRHDNQIFTRRHSTDPATPPMINHTQEERRQ